MQALGSRTDKAVTRLSVRAGRPVLSAIAQLGERQTEDLKVPDSISGGGIF